MYNLKVKIGKMVWYPRQTIVALGCGFGACSLVWIIASLIEISCKNLSANSIYSVWNFFKVIPF